MQTTMMKLMPQLIKRLQLKCQVTMEKQNHSKHSTDIKYEQHKGTIVKVYFSKLFNVANRLDNLDKNNM